MNDFGHGFMGFGTFCYDVVVFATPQCPPPQVCKVNGHCLGSPVQLVRVSSWAANQEVLCSIGGLVTG